MLIKSGAKRCAVHAESLLRKYLAVTNGMNIPEKVENVSTVGFCFVFVEIPVVEMQGFGFYFVN